MKQFVFLLLMLFFISYVSCTPSKVVDTYNQQEIEQFLNDQSFQFVARYMQPASGRQRNITGNYTLAISKGKVEADLPYIGRVYSAPIGTDGGVKFSTTDFEYSATELENGRRELHIKPKGAGDVQQLVLTVYSKEGSADLNVTLSNRQGISYRGIIVKKP